MHESIIAFRKHRYLWVALAISALAIAAYGFHDPQEPPNGGTVLGYTLGTIAALLIVWLAWLGVRKRRYSSTLGTVQGWLSAHVYLGVALVLIALLHSGFQFGFNVHTLAFVLMMLVVLSGMYGVFVYLKIPQRVSENRKGVTRAGIVSQLDDIDNRSRRVAQNLSEDFQELVASGASRTQLGGSLWAQLSGKDESQIVITEGSQARVVPNEGQEAALDWLADQQSRSSDPEVAAVIGELSALTRNKRRLLRQMKEEVRLQAVLEAWLYLHVPLTAALIIALFTHIIVVFLYW